MCEYIIFQPIINQKKQNSINQSPFLQEQKQYQSEIIKQIQDVAVENSNEKKTPYISDYHKNDKNTFNNALQISKQEQNLAVPVIRTSFFSSNEQLIDEDDSLQFHSFNANTEFNNPEINSFIKLQTPAQQGRTSQFQNYKLGVNLEEEGGKKEQEQENKGQNNQDEEKQQEQEQEEEEDEDENQISKAKDSNIYFKGNKNDLEKLQNNYIQQLHKNKDEQRVQDAHSGGGKFCGDKGIIQTTRSVGKFIIGEIGRKIISGDFNLTQVSFPIKAMIPKSALQTILYGTCLFPIYINKAAQIKDLVERFKLVITASFGSFSISNTFLKPLNPILGETFQGNYIDGTSIFAEQISHHPPISYFYACGPQKSYKFYGYYLYEAKAGWNSLTLKNKGKRFLSFKDGQKINYNFGYEYYSGTFMGTMKTETLGSVTFTDFENKIEAIINTGKVKKKPSDYISGEIKVNGKVVSTCYGSYLGFIEFDGVRYWDFREILPLQMNVINCQLLSDHQKRQDMFHLSKGNIKKAQLEKEIGEQLQRNDAKLRKKHHEQIVKQSKGKK
ncbi:oxysterol binding, putative [Ichthyophthirius multifiliis]|uniref:Oxysterol binding, putative n=1 Tax=Ichthyophthirius multifiliis TaxID=5932 RepID=G0QPR6_ICHMU|nr:oxysterol binding, putative [Ichthyophthirius multifiliis]EGR32781.1 oxysterol binding, putative [Ichthyophthirius multifiliis]|eukprot:XP_004036767.1 oxysterol binding, putative [Ichthyophthirius multifiliis]